MLGATKTHRLKPVLLESPDHNAGIGCHWKLYGSRNATRKQSSASSDRRDSLFGKGSQQGRQTRIRGRARCLAGIEKVCDSLPRRPHRWTRNYCCDLVAQGAPKRFKSASALGPAAATHGSVCDAVSGPAKSFGPSSSDDTQDFRTPPANWTDGGHRRHARRGHQACDLSGKSRISFSLSGFEFCRERHDSRCCRRSQNRQAEACPTLSLAVFPGHPCGGNQAESNRGA